MSTHTDLQEGNEDEDQEYQAAEIGGSSDGKECSPDISLFARFDIWIVEIVVGLWALI